MKYCTMIGSTLNFGMGTIAHCCSAINAPFPDACVFQGGAFPYEEYLLSCKALNEANQTQAAPCGGCYHLQNRPDITDANRTAPLQSCSINCFSGCNLDCIYCSVHDLPFESFYDISETLADMLSRGIIDKETTIIWGGGEPTLYPHFGKTVTLLLGAGIKQIINSNAVLFSQEAALALSQKGSILQVSIDSGTRETYKAIKGGDHFDKVKKNLSAYSKANPDQVRLKYIMMEENSSTQELTSFVALCKELGIKHAVMSVENLLSINSQFHDRLVEKMGKLADMLEREGISIDETIQYFDDRQQKLYASTRFHGLLSTPTRIVRAVKRHGLKGSVKAMVERIKTNKNNNAERTTP